MPLSYVIAQCLLGVGFSSFTAQRDFVMLIIATALLWGICMQGSKLLRQHRLDTNIE